MFENRELLKHEVAEARHKKNREDGTFETINEIFQRLPLPRLEKANYKFLFEKVKYNVETILGMENKIQ